MSWDLEAKAPKNPTLVLAQALLRRWHINSTLRSRNAVVPRGLPSQLLQAQERENRKASDYAYHEKALRQAVEAMGCDVISNTTSLIVLNLPGKLAGKEKDLVAGCRAHGFGIWPTLSEPVQMRIGILNQLTPDAITEITSRFAEAMLEMGAEFDKQRVMKGLMSYYAKAA